jgi:signal transduction histidine kinase
VNLNDAVREVVALMLAEIRRHDVTLRMELLSDLEPVYGDRVQLQQVTLNLVLNAIESMSGQSDQPRQLVIGTTRSGVNEARITVRDSGAGLEPQDVERIFDAFYTTKPQGMGIGLSISRSIVEAHQGRLWASGNNGPGAAFHFTVPIAPIPAAT